MLEQAFGILIDEIALDIGSSNIRVFTKGRGVCLEEPAVVIAEEYKNKHRIIAFGTEAQKMVGRTPEHQQAIYPLQGGIFQPKLAEQLIHNVIRKALGGKTLFKPRSVAGFSQYFQTQAKHTLTSILQQTAGKDVQCIEGLICSALGCSLSTSSSKAMMLLDIGFSGTEIGVFCHSNIYRKHFIPIAGKHFNLSIQQHLKTKFEAEFSPHIIEDLKRNLCDISTDAPFRSQIILGKNIKTSQPKEVEISVSDISAALQQPLTILINGIYAEFSRLSPRVVSDLMENGILLCGGGAQLTNLSSFLQEKLHLPVILVDNPQRAMVLGASQLLAQEPYAHWMIR